MLCLHDPRAALADLVPPHFPHAAQEEGLFGGAPPEGGKGGARPVSAWGGGAGSIARPRLEGAKARRSSWLPTMVSSVKQIIV